MLFGFQHAMAQEKTSKMHITITEDDKVTTDTSFELEEGQDPEERDPLLTFCVAHVLICHYMSARWQVHWPNYVVTEREQLARNADLVGATGPLLVQTFNAFNVHLPSGRVIETRSYLTAFLVWLTILERQHACVLERVDLRATYDIVTHFSRRHAAEQTQMGGTDAVDAGMSGSECESDADAGDSDCGLPGFDLV